jgi:transposase-like protein
VQRCTVHKHRNLLAHAPERLHDEISTDYNDMIYATTREEIEARRKAFIRKPGTRGMRARWPRSRSCGSFSMARLAAQTSRRRRQLDSVELAPADDALLHVLVVIDAPHK